MKNILTPLIAAVVELAVLTALAIIPSIVVYIDVGLIGHQIGELSVTEIIQEILLFLTAFIFGYGAWNHPGQRGFLVLGTGFFSCAFIRELDGLFDLVWHGFWLIPAGITALVAILYVLIFHRQSVIDPMLGFLKTKSYYFILIGLIMLLIFSRTFGSGHLLWKNIMGASYATEFKSAVQEGLELFGYIHIFYGALLFWRKDFHS